MEQFQSSIRTHEEEIAALKGHVSDEERETAARLDELEVTRQQRKAERDKLAGAVRKDVLAQYEAIRRRRGAAVVPARHGVCTGCNMHLPPQLYNILQVGTTMEHCPSCHRIIYFDPESAG